MSCGIIDQTNVPESSNPRPMIAIMHCASNRQPLQRKFQEKLLHQANSTNPAKGSPRVDVDDENKNIFGREFERSGFLFIESFCHSCATTI